MLSNHIMSLFFAFFVALFCCVDISAAKSKNGGLRTYGDAVAFRRTMLQAHNDYRKMHQAGPLRWDRAAAAHASQHAQKCVFEHSSGSKYGENIAAGYSSSGDAVKDWFAEGSKYNYNSPGFSEEAGHFTQVVWKGTGAVGCAAAYCNGMLGSGKSWFLVCNYNAAGNMEGEYPQNVLPPSN